MASTISQNSAPLPPFPPPSQPPPPLSPPPQQSSAAVSSSPLSGIAVPSQRTAAAAAVLPARGAAVYQNRSPTALEANSIRLSAVAERIALHSKGTLSHDAPEYSQLCIALARGIDYALANEDIPKTAHCLPSIIKQVYLRGNDPSLQSAISVLMISTKHACKSGWFHSADADELLCMANELRSSFCMEVIANTEASNVLDTISKIMPRFYPKLKFTRLIGSFEAKPGYNILMDDFHIERNFPRQDRIVLFVVQTDNLETSSCIISPPHVSFLVNGKGVEKRTNVSQDNGPQFPTDITKMLKYGTNIIQAVGYFSGSCLIAIAFTGKITSSSAPILEDYVQPTVSTLASDSEIIEGPSRISLNCPISFKRIKTPVKGQLCKHHQCFDYENFMEMNSRKPSWRCPCCNQPACSVDLRIDQNMVKILGEVGEDVGDIVIFADGSWKVVAEYSRSMNQLHNGINAGRQDSDMDCQSNRSTSTLMDAVDLTMEEDVNSSIINGCVGQSDNLTCGSEDRKPFHAFPVSQVLSEPALGMYTTLTTQADGYHIGSDIRSRVLSSVSASNISLVPTRPDGRAEQPLVSMLPNVVMTPIVTDAVSPAPNRGYMPCPEISHPTFSYQHASQVWQPVENMQLQQTILESSIISSETERPAIPRYVNRTPIAIQALPVQTQAPSSSLRMRTNVVNPTAMIPNGSSSATYQAIHSDGFNAVSRDMEMLEMPRASDNPVTQNRDHLDQEQFRYPAVQQIVGLPAANLTSLRVPLDKERVCAYRAPLQSTSDHQIPHNQLPNLRLHRTMSQPTIILAQSPRDPLSAANLAAAHATRLPTGTVNSNLSWMASSNSSQRTAIGGVPPSVRVDSFQELPSEQHWRPTGRMRGSLTGSAYSAALNHYLVPSTQPVLTTPHASTVASASDPLSQYLLPTISEPMDL